VVWVEFADVAVCVRLVSTGKSRRVMVSIHQMCLWVDLLIW